MDTIDKLSRNLNDLVKRVDDGYASVSTEDDILIQLTKEIGKLARAVQGKPVTVDYVEGITRDIVIAGLKLAAIANVDVGNSIKEWLASKS